MRSKKFTAVVLATVMVVGSSMTAFAANTGDATGTGTLLPHLDKDVITVTLPTSTQTANVFDFTVDPEALIKDAAKMQDGTAVTGNEEGVYFKNAGSAAVNGTATYTSATNTGNYTVTISDLTINTVYTYDGTTDNQWEDSEGNAASVTITITDNDNSNAAVTPVDGDTVTVTGGSAAGAATYSNKSDAVEFKGENSVNVDVTVVAAVEASAGGKDIALVADQAALDSATAPALLMTLKVGANEKAITTASGATAKAMIAGAPDNFKVDAKSDGTGYEYVKKADADATKWGSATVQLVGKTNKVDVPTGADAVTAPKVKLTWTITKSDPAAYGNWDGSTLWLGKDANTGFSKTGLTVGVSGDGVTYSNLANDKYSIGETGWVGITWDNIVAGIGESDPTIYVRITDGSTNYVFINN